MGTLDNNEMEALEILIDRHGLFEVLVSIATTCGDKAAFIRADGGPGVGRVAQAWDNADATVKSAAEDDSVLLVSP